MSAAMKNYYRLIERIHGSITCLRKKKARVTLDCRLGRANDTASAERLTAANLRAIIVEAVALATNGTGPRSG